MVAFVAPMTLVLGAGLFAAGLLSFVDIHFFQTKLAERAALAAGLALILLTELMFASSSMSQRFLNGQRSDVLECRLDAETALPEERHKNSQEMQNRIVQCMKGFGYKWTTGHKRCKEAPVATNAFCYLPTRPFDRVVTEFLMMFE
ncbi:MAG TPA: hypothetical protein VIE47_04710 [Methylocystis sp.]|jgi:hypothetical protein